VGDDLGRVATSAVGRGRGGEHEPILRPFAVTVTRPPVGRTRRETGLPAKAGTVDFVSSASGPQGRTS
jgi:hypothetical protein